MSDEKVETAVTVQRPPLREMLTTLKDAGPTFMEMYARDIIDREVAMAKFDQNWRLARVFAESGMFADVQQVAQAMAKIQLGEAWGMVASDAMQHVYFVKGKPAIQNEYLAAKMRDAGIDWEVEWHREGGQCVGCTLWPTRLQMDGSYKPITERRGADHIPASVSFMKADAERAGLMKNDTYKNYAEDMFFWRCIARLRRRYATNILSGVLTRDEAEEITADATVSIASLGPTSAPIAEKTQAKAEEITERIRRTRQAKPAPEPPAAAGPVAVHTPSGPVAVQAHPGPVAVPGPVATVIEMPSSVPWTDQSSCLSALRAEKAKDGDRFDRIRKEINVSLSSENFYTDPKVAEFYKRLTAEDVTEGALF